ncbi:unnamed protein product [Gemmataceae bacterium]|nr:unnamed protein product [Gemmataceae bacterium]VTU02531.1 unnamed protein product [Gemmataceae bacterium]
MGVQRSRSLGSRLAHLEARVPTPSFEAAGPRTEDEWLVAFEEMGRDGSFAPEPEFPEALARFRDALAAARASTDPPFDPPPEFEPGHPSPHQRQLNWRTGGRFPDLDAAFLWIAEMVHRVESGIPPVTGDEFRELAAWFAANAARLRQLAGPSEVLELGGGRRTGCGYLRYYLAKGHRADGAGQLAQDIRELRRRCGQAPGA